MTECKAFCDYFPQEGEQCDELIGMVLQREECNAFDEDCDQLLDEQLVQDCYTGEPDTLGVGVCNPGTAQCNLGVWGSEVEGVFVPGLCAGEVCTQR